LGITLSVLTGTMAGRKLRLMNGQTAQFGRTEWADYAFPDDELMGDIHFVIECSPHRCQLRDLGTKSRTLIGDCPVTEAQLHSGDEVTAGRTVFSVTVDGEAVADRVARASQQKSLKASATSTTPSEPTRSLLRICQFLEFDPSVVERVSNPAMEPDLFVKVLADQRQFVPALRLRAHLLSRRDAVWWGSACMRECMADELTDKENLALNAADQWVKSEDEADRRKAQQAAEVTNFETAAAWIALGAFWAAGSLTDPNSPKVAPDERLTGQAITGALLMLAAKAPAGEADARYVRFLEIADSITSGNNSGPRKLGRS